MAVISNQQRQAIPTFVEDPDGVSVRCRKASDAELIQLINRCDDWMISSPDLRPSSTAPESLARRLRALQFRLADSGEEWRVGADDDFSLAAERLQLMLDHGRELFIGSSPCLDRNGSIREVGLIAIAPYECRACDVIVNLQRT